MLYIYNINLATLFSSFRMYLPQSFWSSYITYSQVDKVRKENRKKESHLLVEQIIKEEMTAEHLQNQAADSDDDGKHQDLYHFFLYLYIFTSKN